VSTDVSEEHIAYIFRVEEINSARNQQTSRWQAWYTLFLAELIFFYPEYGGDIFLRNVG
jgi:hypothetical protein